MIEVAYDADVDILSIVLVSKRVKESAEILPGVVVDFDDEDRAIAFEIFDVSKIADSSQIKVEIPQVLLSKERRLK